MNISQYIETVKMCRKVGIPLMVWGPGGIGKTRGSEQAAREMKIEHQAITAPLLDPSDLLGIPHPDKTGKKTIWLRPSFLPENGEGLLLVDELPDAPPLVKKALYQLFLDHKVKDHIVPKEWFIMGAGNRPEDSSYSTPMPAPLITRMCHIGVYCTTPDFTRLTPASAQIEETDFLPYAIQKFHPVIGGYLKFNSRNIFNHQATPRTWEFISNLLHAIPEVEWDNFSFKSIIYGLIGQEIGIEFTGYIKLFLKIPSIERIISDPVNTTLPDIVDGGILYALTVALMKKLSIKTVDSIITYILRMPKEIQGFFMVMASRTFTDIVANPKFLAWRNDNRHIMV